MLKAASNFYKDGAKEIRITEIKKGTRWWVQPWVIQGAHCRERWDAAKQWLKYVHASEKQKLEN